MPSPRSAPNLGSGSVAVTVAIVAGTLPDYFHLPPAEIVTGNRLEKVPQSPNRGTRSRFLSRQQHVMPCQKIVFCFVQGLCIIDADVGTGHAEGRAVQLLA